MRLKAGIWIWFIAFGVLCAAAGQGGDAPRAEQFVGTWTGTWDGAGSGGFELILEKWKDTMLTGRVSVTGDPTYKATLKTVSFDGAKMTGKYDFPPDERAEVEIVLTFDGKAAKGTWRLVEKGTTNEVANGALSLTKN